MSKEENLKKNLKSGKRRASRLVALDDAAREQLLKAVLEKTLLAKTKPKPIRTEKTSKVLGDLIATLLHSDLEAEPEHLVEGIMQALESGILGGNFMAPAEATISGWVKAQMKARAEELHITSTRAQTGGIAATVVAEAALEDHGPIPGPNATDDPLNAIPY